jgi:hypothetical protein
MEGMMIHRYHAEEMIVSFSDGLPGPMSVDVTWLEVLKIGSKRSFKNCHDY